MSINYQKTVKYGKDKSKKVTFNVEVFDSAGEVVEVSARRKVTNREFYNFDNGYMPEKKWCGGFETFEEVKEAMRSGYQPTVEKLKGAFKANLAGQAKRISFFNDVVGFAPIVPLALMGIPTAMQNSYMKPIKAKVIDVYYDMSCCCDVTSDQIIKAGQDVLGALLELEMQGYKFNLYAIQSYYEGSSADVLCTKIKSSNTPLDLKRISFPLTHTAYFRCIGFDWYSKTPKGTFRWGYGRDLCRDQGVEDAQDAFRELFGRNSVIFFADKLRKESLEYVKATICESSKAVKSK